MIQIAKGCDYLHNMGVIHGDLKPDNILLRMSNQNQSIVAKVHRKWAQINHHQLNIYPFFTLNIYHQQQ